MEQNPIISPEAARAILAQPSVPLSDLASIAIQHPGLRTEVARHASADRAFLEWLPQFGDPEVTAIAAARLALAAPAAPHIASATLPAHVEVPAPARRGRRWWLWGGAVVGVAVLVGAAVLFVLPTLRGGGEAVAHAPEFRDLPGITAIDLLEGLPADQEWGTDVIPTGPTTALAHNSTNAAAAYAAAMEEYDEEVAELAEWVAEYTDGYDQGRACVSQSGAPDSYWYDTWAEYCKNSTYSVLTNTTSGSVSGYRDAVAGLAANAEHPTNGTAPNVSDKPEPPTHGSRLVGLSLDQAKTTWEADLSTLVRPGEADAPTAEVQRVALQSGDGAPALAILVMETVGDRAWLLVLDPETGTVGAKLDSTLKELSGLVAVVGDVVVVSNGDGALRGLSRGDLSRVVWSSSATVAFDAGDSYEPVVLPDGRLMTSRGILDPATGDIKGFARVDGLIQIPGPAEALAVADYSSERLRLHGYDASADAETWSLTLSNDDVPGAPLYQVGDRLLAVSGGEVSAYRVRGDDLEELWSTRCSDSCGVQFADSERAYIMDGSMFMVVAMNSGDELGALPAGDLFVAPSVAYSVDDGEVIAYDVGAKGLPELWSSIEVSGWVSQYGDHLVINDGYDSGLLGVLGTSGDDWSRFAAEG